MAAPTVVGTVTSAWNSVASNTLTITTPTGLQDGDYLVAFLRSQSPTATADWSSTGWARISPAFLASQAGPRLIGIYGMAVPSASAVTATSFTFTFTGGAGRVIGAIAIVRGVDLTAPVVATSPDYGGTNISNGSRIASYADSAAANSLALGIYGGELVSGNTNAITITPNPVVTITTVYTNDSANDGTTGTSGSRTALTALAYPGSTTLPYVDVAWGTITGNGAQGVTLKGLTALPVASFTDSTTGLQVSVDGSGSSDSAGTITSYAWNFGDTSTATGATTTHTYASGGTYTITLTVTDNNGGTNTATHSVTVNASSSGISVRSYTTLTAVSYVDATATPGSMIVPPADLAVGDYLVVGVFFAQGDGSGSVYVPSGFTQLTPNGTASNRLFVTYGRMMSTSADVSAVASGVYLRAGYTATRIVAIAAALTGVKAFSSAGVIGYSSTSISSVTFSAPVTGDADFYLVATNSSSPSTSPAHTSVGGVKIVQAMSPSSATSPYSDSQLSLMMGGTGANFAAAVANGGSVGFSFTSVTSGTPSVAPTRVGYSFLDPSLSNTVMTLDPSVINGGSAILTGHWMIAALALSSGTATVTPPIGWTTLKAYETVGTLVYVVYGRIRQSGDTTYAFTVSSSANVAAATLMWGNGADPTISNWIVGATTDRTDSLHNTASSITTTVDHSLVLGFSFERTIAAESAITSLTGATEWFFLPQYSTTQIQTLDVSYIADVSPVAMTSSMVWTYPNPQATNGAAFQIAIPPAPTGTQISVGYSGVLRTTGGTNYYGKLFYWDGSAAHDFSMTLTKIFAPVTVTQFMAHTPWFAAHRGFSYSYPEETLYSYRGATDWGIKAIEISVQKSADGTFWCFHDATTDRTTGVSGTISAMTDAQISVLNNSGSTATANSSQPGRPVAKLVDVLNTYTPTHVIIIEDKTYANTTAMLNLMDSYGTAGRPASEIFIWKVTSSAGKATFFDPAATRGYHRWAYIFDATMSTEFPALPASGKADMIGMDFNSSDATLSSAISLCVSNGVMPTGHIINSTTQRDRLLGLGMKGLMISNKDIVPPWYNTWQP